MPTFVVVCGNGETDAAKEMVPLINSLILLSSSTFRLVFVTDEYGARVVDNMTTTLLEKTTKLEFVDVRIIHEFDEIETYAHKISFNLHSHHAGIWGFVKVILPWMLVEYPRFAVIDSDMVFVQDPLLIWQHFYDDDNHNHDSENPSEWLYALDLNDSESPSTICSCVVLMKASLILSSNIFPDGFKHALEQKPEWYTNVTNDYLVPHGDQGLYFSLSEKNRSIISSLAAKWNVDRCHNYLHGALQNFDGELGLLHRNCYNDTEESHRHDAAAPFFDFYRAYQLTWLPATDVIKSKSLVTKTGNATLVPLK